MKENDENWWASVLADENHHEELASQNDETAASSFNWEKAQNLYQEDGIVSLEVVGHNQGGVLVEGSDLRGFVPLSHLLRLQENDSV